MVSPRPLRLLVTDDDPIQLRAAARLLKTLGHSGALATQGQMALDLRMPVLDGLGTLERLRPRYPALPVVLVSGDDLGANWSFYRDAGADAYLTKPLDVGALSALLQRKLR